jgi:hypothetical protein
MHNTIAFTGRIGGVAVADTARLSVVALRGNTVLATAPLGSDGSYRISLPRGGGKPRNGALQLALLPSIAAAYPDRVSNAPRAALHVGPAADDAPLAGPSLAVDHRLMDEWSVFWREWQVRGTLTGPDGCPAPGAAVTISTVYWSGGAYHQTARATATTGPDGAFILGFPWWDLFFSCWPCEPIWWLCWPWWWEQDILHVIGAVERRRAGRSDSLFRPDGDALIRGEGFSGDTGFAARKQDPARTALIRQKFADKALRDAFPWWWWSCDEPNILFGATQGAAVILAEDPALDTRWCMPSGRSVTLCGSAATLTAGVLADPPGGMAWTRVGDIRTSAIDSGGLAQDTGDWVDVAFAGWLELHAAIAPGACDYYQVRASAWSAPACRGGTPPAPDAGVPIAATLWQTVWIFDPKTLETTAHDVKMGPFAAPGVPNLYATQAARQNRPAPPGLEPFPPVPDGGEVFWAQEELVLATSGATLLGGIAFGTVDVSLAGYSEDFAPLPVPPHAPLTLTIDETPVSLQSIDRVAVVGEASAEISVTVRDRTGFLYGYELEARDRDGNAALVVPPGVRGYISNPLAAGAGNPDMAAKSWVGGTEAILVQHACTVRLFTGKRVTDGCAWPSLRANDRDEASEEVFF